MAIVELFSKRQKKLRGEFPDVYMYDDVPGSLRAQISHIINDAFGYPVYYVEQCYITIHQILLREYGVLELTPFEKRRGIHESVHDFLLTENDIEKVLDVVELCFRMINNSIRKNRNEQHSDSVLLYPDEAIQDLNSRFHEHGVGYQFESNQIIRVDSQLLHSEVIKPVLVLLSDVIYAGAQEEFLKAHGHYREGRNKECLNECLKAFESVMKIICTKRKWNFNSHDTAQKLIDALLKNELVPTYMQSQLTSLGSLLVSGIPTIRNKVSGHGQGTDKKDANDHLTSYALHLTATNILFLVESEKALS